MRLTSERSLVIAEAGVNHNGSLDLACQLAYHAIESGADYVKYQTFVPGLVASAQAPVTAYQSEAGFQNQESMLSSFVLSEEEHQRLKEHCDEIGIGFASTGHDIDSANFLESLGQDFVKVGSGDLTNWQLLEVVASYGRPVLLSTGASNWKDVEATVIFLEQVGLSVPDNLVLLQCTSSYPAPSEEANIRVLTRYREAFGCRVGFSDHTLSGEASLAAVALGACIVEKHLTIDKSMEGPDHKASLDPAEFRKYVASLRRLEGALGTREKIVTASEEENQAVIRKSLYARTQITAGEPFSLANVIAKRPVSRVPASSWREIKGQLATRDYAQDEPIEDLH